MGWISERKMRTGHGLAHGHKKTERSKAPLKKIVETLLPIDDHPYIAIDNCLNEEIQKHNLNEEDLKLLVNNIFKIQSENYVSKRKRTKEELFDILGLTP